MFLYIGLCDCYLVMCDMLYDILGINVFMLYCVLVCLEDVNVMNIVMFINMLMDYFYSKRILFLIVIILLYKDLNGVYNGGVL